MATTKENSEALVRLPRWYLRFGRPLRMLAFVLAIPFAAAVIEIILDWSRIYSSPNPWPLWFNIVGLALGIPALMLLEATDKLRRLKAHLEALASNDQGVRKASAMGLRAFKSYARYTVPALIASMSNSDELTREVLRQTLQELTGKDQGLDERQWRDWIGGSKKARPKARGEGPRLLALNNMLSGRSIGARTARTAEHGHVKDDSCRNQCVGVYGYCC